MTFRLSDELYKDLSTLSAAFSEEHWGSEYLSRPIVKYLGDVEQLKRQEYIQPGPFSHRNEFDVLRSVDGITEALTAIADRNEEERGQEAAAPYRSLISRIAAERRQAQIAKKATEGTPDR